MQKVLITDNNDSFTYNLVQMIDQIGNCKFEIHKTQNLNPEIVDGFDKILISPGPGLPSEIPFLKEMIKIFAPVKNILGVCLGHQAIAEVFGCKLKHMPKILHGEHSQILTNNTKHHIFNNIPSEFIAGRYHSWVVDPFEISNEIEVTAVDLEGNIMALKHKKFNVHGVQFHPESIMTPYGNQMIKNWLVN